MDLDSDITVPLKNNRDIISSEFPYCTFPSKEKSEMFDKYNEEKTIGNKQNTR